MSANPKPIGAIQFRSVLEKEGKVAAGKLVNPLCATEQEAEPLILFYIQTLLAARQFVAAGIVLWGEKIFNARPSVVQKVWRAISKHKKVIIPGAASLSKTYAAACWLMLRWWADPEGTTIKIISTTGKHAESNFFATIKMMHRLACVPMVGVVSTDEIRFDEQNKRAAISIVRIRQGEDNSEVLQGFHPLPRQTPHPVYGDTTAVIAALDEAEGIPGGVWTGIENMTASGDADHVKAMAFYNPKDITAKPAQIAEPKGGWGEFDVETGVRGSNEWVSVKGWFVVRLDAAEFENVKQRKEIYAGFQTWEYYRANQLLDDGQSQKYFVFCRGAYPPDSAVKTVCPQRVVSAMRGHFVFSGPTTNCGALDTAVDGRDDAVFTFGRYGLARAFKRAKQGADGRPGFEIIEFKKERQVLQIEQQFPLIKGSTEIVANSAMETCALMKVAPENFILDATGNGEPVFILLKTRQFMGEGVRGVRFGDPATATKILEEDRQTAEEQYDGLCSEVLFAVTRWGEFGFLAIAPGMHELERQLIGRQYKLGRGQTLKVEDKDDYKKRLGRSPDHAESMSVLLHGVRTGGKVARAAMLPNAPKPQFRPEEIARVEWLPDDGESFGGGF